MNISENMLKEIVKEVIAKMGGMPSASESFDKKVDSSGILLVKTETVKPPLFEHGERVYLQDVVSLEESPRMGAGIMELRDTDFEWTLTYDEFDYVIEGTLEIEVDGRTIVANKGDIVYIPKDTKIHFKTPDFARFLYVVYPADWQSQ